MENPLVSIIVPVYKVEAYLPACVDSLLASDYRPLEILLVDDGSPDGCGAICDAYADAQPGTVRVIHQENQGLSGARNTGLAAAKGEYIAFVDSDDWIDPNMIGRMAALLTATKADLALCGWRDVWDDGREPLPHAYTGPDNMTGREAVRELVRQEELNVQFVVAWNRLARRGVYERFAFRKGKWHEDEFAALRVLSSAKRVVGLTDCFYQYRQRAGSIMASRSDIRTLDKVEALTERYRDICRLGFTESEDDAFRGLVNIYIATLRDYPQKTAQDRQRFAQVRDGARSAIGKRFAQLNPKEKLAFRLPRVWKTLFALKQKIK